MEKSQLFWQTYLNIEKEVLELSKTIYFSDAPTSISETSHQLETYSPYIADLLIKCCVEIEAISKELYFDNGGTKSRGSKDLYYDTDCIDLIYKKWDLGKKEVIVVATNFNLTKDENRILKPLKNANKQSKIYWAKAYQAVKHNRYDCLYYGNIKALLQALAALYLLNIYYRDVKLFSKYKDYKQLDMSLGSKIFTLKTPNEAPQIWYGNKSKAIDSPYVVNYTKESYAKIRDYQNNNSKTITEYFQNQPETKEQEFLLMLKTADERKQQDPKYNPDLLSLLCQYRLNKEAPQTLGFERRKKVFYENAEKVKDIKNQDKSLIDIELTPENIEYYYEVLAGNLATKLQMSLTRMNWIIYMMTEANCEIIIDK